MDIATILEDKKDLMKGYSCYSLTYNISKIKLPLLKKPKNIIAAKLRDGITVSAKDMVGSLELFEKTPVESYMLDKRYERKLPVSAKKDKHLQGLLSLLNMSERKRCKPDVAGTRAGSLVWVHTKGHDSEDDMVHYHILHFTKRTMKQMHCLSALVQTATKHVGKGTRTSRAIDTQILHVIYNIDGNKTSPGTKYFIGATNTAVLQVYRDVLAIYQEHGKTLTNKLKLGSPCCKSDVDNGEDEEGMFSDNDSCSVDNDSDSSLSDGHDNDDLNSACTTEILDRSITGYIDKAFRKDRKDRLSQASELDRIKAEQTKSVIEWLAGKFITSEQALVAVLTSPTTSAGDVAMANKVLLRSANVKSVYYAGAANLLEFGTAVFKPIPAVVGVTRNQVQIAWDEASLEWKRLLIGLIAMMRSYNEQKQGYIWVYGPANMGKTTVLRTYLTKILLFCTLNPITVPQFFFGEYGKPARLVILDDVSVVPDQSNITTLKNVLGREVCLVNPKYAGVCETKNQPSLFLQNVRHFRYSDKLSDKNVHRNALKARRYLVTEIKNKYFPNERAFLAMMIALDKYVVARYEQDSNEFKDALSFPIPDSFVEYCPADDIESG